MFNVGGGELLVIFLVALIVLGPTKLPDAARQVGKVMGEFRRLSSGFQREFREAMNDPVTKVVQSAEKSTQTPTTPLVENTAPDVTVLARTEPAEPLTPADSSDSHDDSTADNSAREDREPPSIPTAAPADEPNVGQPDVDELDDPPEAPMFGDR